MKHGESPDERRILPTRPADQQPGTSRPRRVKTTHNIGRLFSWLLCVSAAIVADGAGLYYSSRLLDNPGLTTEVAVGASCGVLAALAAFGVMSWLTRPLRGTSYMQSQRSTPWTRFWMVVMAAAIVLIVICVVFYAVSSVGTVTNSR